MHLKKYQSKYDKKRSRLAVSLHPYHDIDILNHVDDKIFSKYVKELIRLDITGTLNKSNDFQKNKYTPDLINTVRNKLHLWHDQMQGVALVGLKSNIVKRLNLDSDFINSLSDDFLYSLINFDL